MEQIDKFLKQWQKDSLNCKPAFIEMKDYLSAVPSLALEFVERPGISYSLRAKNRQNSAREIVALVDIVDDEPDNRWLSVCFYADMVADPSELGDFVPKGLMGEDAMCFNLDEDDAGTRDYIFARLKDAAANAGRQI